MRHRSVPAQRGREPSSRRRTARWAAAWSLVWLLWMLSEQPVHAYLDPGTGSALLSVVIGIIGSGLFWVRTVFYGARALTYRIGSTPRRNRQADLVFYSEGGHYWDVFEPVLTALEAAGVRADYLTSDRDDPGLARTGGLTRCEYLGGSHGSIAQLNRLRAQLVVLTVPHLDVLTLRRSRGVTHYAHLIHSPADVLLYKKYAFDCFDTVLCSGRHQIDNLRLLETSRGLRAKSLLKTGCTYYDRMCGRLAAAASPQPDLQTILVAPTWGKNSCLAKYGTALIEPLLQAGYRVVLRPHPQMLRSQRDVVNGVMRVCRSHPSFRLDESPSPSGSMGQASLLVSDLSGIVFDFAFLYQRPVVSVDPRPTRVGFEIEDLGPEAVAWEQRAVHELGAVVTGDEVGGIESVVRRELAAHRPTDITAFRDRSCYNFGHAGEVAARQLVSILDGL